jgi:hypothetical protein
MRRVGWVAALLCALLLPTMEAAAQASDRIWGSVLTSDGDRIEGFIRWDRNEANWSDLFDGSREIVWDDIDLWEEAVGEGDGENDRSIEFMGIRVSWDDDDSAFPLESTSGIRFGHIARLSVTGRQSALLQLRSGESVEFTGGSTDIGPEIREILVEVPGGRLVELDWRDLDEIEFSSAPPSALPEAARLFGTVVDHSGNEYTGQVAWGLDEVLTSDVLEGDDLRGREQRVMFGSIAAIERVSRGRSLVILRDGTEMELSGTSDVGRGNRGIQISDPELGQVDVDWDEFESVGFHAPDDRHSDDSPALASYDGGHRLRGTVVTEDGDQHTGWIRWDADESYSWEILDGQMGDVTFDIEFGQISRIEKASWNSAAVTLLDGRMLELEDSNDVDENNRGIFIETDTGERFVIDWFDFASITFDHN